MAKKHLARRPATDLSRSPVARYIQLATLFRNRIASGEWPVGSRIPNVDELAASFSVARGTMREALGLLEQEGLLERLRAKGTFVRKSPGETRTHRMALDWTSLTALHEGATIELLEQRVLKSVPVLDRSKGRPGSKYRMMRRLHLVEGMPYLVASFYLDEVLFRKHASLYRKWPALTTMRRVAGHLMHRTWQTLTVDAADMEVAALLKIPLNAPVARVDLLTVDREGVILYTGSGVFRGDSVCIETELR